MILFPIVGIVIETQTEPVVLCADRASQILAHLSDTYCGTVKIVGEIGGTDVLYDPAFIVSLTYGGTYRLGTTVKHCDIISVRHSGGVVLAVDSPDLIETLLQELCKIGCTLLH